MSKIQAEEFYKSLANDKERKEQVMALKDPSLEQLTALAREAGYEVEKEDFIELMNGSDEFHVDDDMLDKLSDGCGGGGGGGGGCVEICGLHLGHLSGHSS